MRTRYLLCYDVRDDVRLRRAERVADEFGYRLQYSVFICDLSDVERTRLEQAVRNVVNFAEDRVVLVELGPPSTAKHRLHWLTLPSPVLHEPTDSLIV
ncbi:MAG TPA: CRISPR-associated endonuclease Cas2 [Gaiellaceae bacterium]|nr:CRISPR-associated endonuclease Cas2 [Gaiellaceae bacterium]